MKKKIFFAPLGMKANWKFSMLTDASTSLSHPRILSNEMLYWKLFNWNLSFFDHVIKQQEKKEKKIKKKENEWIDAWTNLSKNLSFLNPNKNHFVANESDEQNKDVECVRSLFHVWMTLAGFTLNTHASLLSTKVLKFHFFSSVDVDGQRCLCLMFPLVEDELKICLLMRVDVFNWWMISFWMNSCFANGI